MTSDAAVIDGLCADLRKLLAEHDRLRTEFAALRERVAEVERQREEQRAAHERYVRDAVACAARAEEALTEAERECGELRKLDKADLLAERRRHEDTAASRAYWMARATRAERATHPTAGALLQAIAEWIPMASKWPGVWVAVSNWHQAGRPGLTDTPAETEDADHLDTSGIPPRARYVRRGGEWVPAEDACLCGHPRGDHDGSPHCLACGCTAFRPDAEDAPAHDCACGHPWARHDEDEECEVCSCAVYEPAEDATAEGRELAAMFRSQCGGMGSGLNPDGVYVPVPAPEGETAGEVDLARVFDAAYSAQVLDETAAVAVGVRAGIAEYHRQIRGGRRG